MLPLHVSPGQVAELIPEAIERLAHPDPTERLRAAEFLTKWTGQTFWAGRLAPRRQAPDPGEARRLKERWEQWWAESKESYRAPTQ